MGNSFSAIIVGLGRILRHKLYGIKDKPKATLLTIPADVLDLVLHFIVTSQPHQPFSHERSSNAALIPLSQTCQEMRVNCCPWIFREVYTWQREEEVWPETLWSFFRTVHLRNRSIRHSAVITLSSSLSSSLQHMPRLTRVTLRLKDDVIPSHMFEAISSTPNLSSLEIYQTRLDVIPTEKIEFPSLTTLVLRISGFEGVHRYPNINKTAEMNHISRLLALLASRLESLTISGDFLDPTEFKQNLWPSLRNFSATDHPPIPLVPITQLVTHMPVLKSLSALYTTDFTSNLRPPFLLGRPSPPFLTETCPLLASVSLSNIGISDPIFLQLPSSIDELHLLAVRDSYGRGQRRPRRRDPITSPLSIRNATTLLSILPKFDQLQKLTVMFSTILMPEFVLAAAAKFRHLTSLHLTQTLEIVEHLIPLFDIRHEETIDALRLFPLLKELKLTIDDQGGTPYRGVPNEPAYQLFCCLPGLQTIGILWKVDEHEDASVWDYWDRSMLSEPKPESLPDFFAFMRDGMRL
ncbi:hypothetical protein MIND_00587200 [Mycena indigotica]|uniref:F-box domain-containing protein n=1 Tax=Mycena indigotica TaxID=2126181 RepID=A0A8H6W8X5_9AGAR|nr:uncharacterized protein MIND_00587200 [Mycena indigotica]KAF7303579.1 hypothetical protein MIND_00587200 [Mycena indigotica]